jgi:hypothetical protein
VYFVPAFSGLFAPYWRDDARGAIVGLTAYANSGHLARAALEATAWQTREVLDAMGGATGAPFSELRVDGGMTANELLMQFQADVLGMPVVRPAVTETTALGAAFAAGLATGRRARARVCALEEGRYEDVRLGGVGDCDAREPAGAEMLAMGPFRRQASESIQRSSRRASLTISSGSRSVLVSSDTPW